MEAVDQRACVEEDLHVDKAWHRPRSHAGNTESARSFYARQLMQPEWLNDVPGDLASHWHGAALAWWCLSAQRTGSALACCFGQPAAGRPQL